MLCIRVAHCLHQVIHHTRLCFTHLFSDYRKKDAATTAAHGKYIMELLKNRKLIFFRY